MTGMFDIHNHILYGVDDGSKTFEMTKAMLEIAYNEGTRGIILTPHHNPYRWKNEVSTLRERYEEIRKYCAEKYSDMELYLGNEIYYFEDALKDIEEGRALTMADSKYVLIEFMPSTEYRDIQHAVMDVQQSGYYPIIAHVERYECLLKKPVYIEELKELGAFIQVNASGIMGERSRLEKKFIKGLLKKGEVDFVATDAHRDNTRQPFIKKCSEYLEKKFGQEYTKQMLIDNPRAVIKNIYIEE